MACSLALHVMALAAALVDEVAALYVWVVVLVNV
jgi:hypothetical protein